MLPSVWEGKQTLWKRSGKTLTINVNPREACELVPLYENALGNATFDINLSLLSLPPIKS